VVFHAISHPGPGCTDGPADHQQSGTCRAHGIECGSKVRDSLALRNLPDEADRKWSGSPPWPRVKEVDINAKRQDIELRGRDTRFDEGSPLKVRQHDHAVSRDDFSVETLLLSHRGYLKGLGILRSSLSFFELDTRCEIVMGNRAIQPAANAGSLGLYKWLVRRTSWHDQVGVLGFQGTGDSCFERRISP
jgi:hypothetical protein